MMHDLPVIEHVIEKQNYLSAKIYLCHALLYLEPKHGLLASTFKVLIGLHWLFNWPGMEEQEFEEEFFEDEHAN